MNRFTFEARFLWWASIEPESSTTKRMSALGSKMSEALPSVTFLSLVKGEKKFFGDSGEQAVN